MYADQDECSGPSSRLQFGCDSSLTFKVRYDPSCRKPNLSLTCVGKIWKIGEFFLVQDVRSKTTSCVFFDKENNQLFRLNSTHMHPPSVLTLSGESDHGKKETLRKSFFSSTMGNAPSQLQVTLQ